MRRRSEFEDTSNSASRTERRSLSRDRESRLAIHIASAHNIAAREYPSGWVAQIYRENLVTQGAPSKRMIHGVNVFVASKHNKRVSSGEDTSRIGYVQEALTDAFRMEYIARAYMQLINEENPDVLQTVFDPSTLRDLPPNLQRIAALDINRGMGDSILLDNATKLAIAEQDPAERLTGYIKANGIPEHVKKSLVTLNIGMKAMGAPSCPFNEVGICTHLLSRIPESALPDDIKKDLASRDLTAAQRRISGLVSFANHNPVSRILDSTIEFNEDIAQPSTSSRKREVPFAKLEKKDMTLVEQAEVETPAFSRVVIRLANQDSEYVIEDPNDKEAVNKAIAALSEEKIVKSYLTTYNDAKLRDMIFNAVNVIATEKSYIHTNRTIVQWVASKNKAHINTDDVKEQFMRYSGAQSTGVSGGPVGRDTRIIFSQGTKNGTRYVTIHRVSHKSDLKTNPVLR
jgi:hypothetical protein